MYNTITLPNNTVLNISKKNLPFENKFKALRTAKQFGEHVDYFHTFVELFGDQYGRVLSVIYTKDGLLVGAHTVN